MKYTRYFAQTVRNYGTPQLSQDNMSVFLNIIHLEAKLEVYNSLNSAHKYSIRIATIKETIYKLTNGLEPRDLINYWLSGERIRQKPFKEEDTPWDEFDPYMR